MRTSLVYVISAIWHGFYPGYYITFFSGAIFTYAARAIRRSVRPYFVGQEKLKMFYDSLTWFTTRLAIAYATFSFVVQDFYPSWNMYIRLYFFVHILATMVIILVPPIFKALPGSISPQRSRSDVSNGGFRIESSSSQPPKGIQSEASVVRNGIIEENMTSLPKEDENRTKSLNKLISNGNLTLFNSIDGNGMYKLNSEIVDNKKLFLNGNINANESQTKVNEDEWKNLVISTGMNGTATAKLKTG